MAHVAAVNAAVLPAHMVQVGDVSVPVTVAPEVAAQVKEFATDVFSYFEQRGAVDADGKINVGKLQEFGLRLANYDAAVAAAAAQGNKAGFAAGVASLVNPGDSSTPAPNSANNQTQPTNQQVPTYWQNRQTAAEIDY